ncbi:MAG: glycosyltransferase [Phormidesmis sp. CAN_BIN44]|nr:glycosyltransferase [Phormidesmis sp. CAN_BIN44]
MKDIKKLPDLLKPPSGDLQIAEFPDDDTTSNDNTTQLNALHPVLLSLVLPTYNEGKNIGNVVRLLSHLLNEAIPGNYELIVVDDDSPDYTWKLAQELMTDHPQLRVMRRQEERGLSSAVIRGWQVASGTVLGVIDADLQHPPEVLLNLLAEIVEQGADLAVASRHVEGGGVSKWSVVRRFLSRGAQILGLIILPQVVGRVSDPMSGYFLVSRTAIAGKTLNPIGYKILIEVLGRSKVEQIAEVGYVFQERQEGESKVSWKQYVEYFLHLLRLRSRGRIWQLRNRLQFPLNRLVRFGLVGLSGVFVDMLVFYLLSDPTTLAWGLTRSKIFAAETAIINNFFWNDRWTFGDISNKQRGWRRRVKRLIKFNTICLAGLILNILMLNIIFNSFGINRYLANLITIAIVTIWNFWINLKLSWRVTDEPGKSS